MLIFNKREFIPKIILAHAEAKAHAHKNTPDVRTATTQSGRLLKFGYFWSCQILVCALYVPHSTTSRNTE